MKTNTSYFESLSKGPTGFAVGCAINEKLIQCCPTPKLLFKRDVNQLSRKCRLQPKPPIYFKK